MTRSCLFKKCKKRPKTRCGRIISIHGFPRELSYIQRWENWVQETCGMRNFNASVSALCSRHFSEKSFRCSLRGSRLRRDAVPSITPDDLDAAEKLVSNAQQSTVKIEAGRAGSDLDAAETLVSYGQQNTVKIDAGETGRSHMPTMTEDAVPQNPNPQVQHEHLTEKYHEVTNTGLEVQDDGEGSSNASPDLQSRKKFAIDLSPEDFINCQKAKKHFKILRNAVTKTRHRLQYQSIRIRRVKNSVLKIRRLIEDLSKEKMVTGEGQAELDVAVNNILNEIDCNKPS